VTEETTDFSYLLSGSTLLLALVGFYIGRALWIARREWAHCGTDTKILYLLVAPLLTLAVDLLEFTDRLFWSYDGKAQPARSMATRRRTGPLHPNGPLRPKMAVRSDA
jgi:hypothetical protein